MLSRPGEELRQSHRARGPRDFLAVPNENETRNATDVKAGSEIGRRLGVHFHEAEVRLELRSGALEYTARAAPSRPEID